jgi:hypothetical protein
VKLSDGGVRNGYTIKLLNKLYEPHSFRLSLAKLPGANFSIVGHEHEPDAAISVPPDELQSLRLYVTLDKKSVAALGGAAADFHLVVTDVATGHQAEHGLTFQGP